jgi:excisionase family DNA binding protein
VSADRVELAIRELVAALRDELRPPPEPSAMVDLRSAARMLQVSRTTLYALMDSGELASRHIGRRRLMSRAALEAYAQGQR